MSFALTHSAVEQVKHLRQSGHDADAALRVSVVGGGCSGFSYKMDFDKQHREYDKEFRFDDVHVLIDPKSYMYLQGVELDFDAGLEGKGFTFQNPNASRTCGCGSSFGV